MKNENNKITADSSASVVCLNGIIEDRLLFVNFKNVFIILSVAFMANPVFADGRSLESVASQLGDKAITVARSFVLFGFAVGAILCFIPWTRHWGIEVLKTSGFGSLIVYGAPALIDFVRSAF
jgi:hypothetical protein